jgi:hypothetical protein
VPRLALKLTRKRSPEFNLGFLAGVTLIGLIGMSMFFEFYGLLPIMALMAVMYCVNFLTSHYLNKITDSQQRATVLSFKGLSYNLAYGLIGLLYSLLLLALDLEAQKEGVPVSADGLKDAVFVQSIAWFPGYFALLLAGLLLCARWRLKGTGPRGVADIEQR